MRNRPLRRLNWRALRALALAGACLGMMDAHLSTPIQAQPAPAGQVEVSLEPPADLVAGDRTQLIVTVRVAPSSDHPILLTARHEGSAVEVVRGRLLRADAIDPNAEVLRFRLPIVARMAGTSVVRVDVLAYACEGTCVALRGEASAVLRVERNPNR